jgi:hypothetical protein
VRFSGELDTLDDIGHRAGAVGAENLDSDDIGLLGDTVLLACDSAGAVGAMSVSIFVGIAGRDGLAPLGAALEVDVLGVGTGVDDVDVNAFAAVDRVEVLVEGSEVECLAVRDAGKTPWCVLLGFWGCLEGVYFLVDLDVFDLFMPSSVKAYRKWCGHVAMGGLMWLRDP